ncbi:splicing factor 3B subunit 1-like [Dorcoceras hygrometricum]|uniref:Splicing factor 3B subunit 1-like n=1 Tax=Dorcoceras hygrometricum TaxID=472368 RepID=A0A2Z7A527_9LAMI|nr:splicing factor 3B subunit 1-like [Dorcoceras hygrometricum]
MESSYISNALRINFDSILGIRDNDGMENMFRVLEATGLRGFLGCPSVLYEQELEQCFDTALIQDGNVTCAVSGKYVVISISRFAGVFNRPTDGLIDLSKVPNDLVLQPLTLFSHSGKPVQFSCKKRLLKYEFRLLNNILAKSITVKAGSFDAVTHERFLMMTAIHFGIKVNWSEILFEVLKEMVDRTTRRAKGFAAQICFLLKGDPVVTLGEAKTFPPLKILSEKMVNTYVATNKTIEACGETDEPDLATVAFVKNKSMSKKRPAAVSDAPVVKKKRTSSGKSVSKEKDLAIVSVALDSERIQTFDPTSAIPAAHPPTPKRRAPKRKLRMTTGSDDVDIIDTVITETTQMETDMEEPSLTRSDDIAFEVSERSSAVNDEDDNLDGAENEIARKMASFTASKQFPQDPLRSGEDDDMSGFKQPRHRVRDIAFEVSERSSAVNDEDDNLDGAENEIARKMASFTASKQFPQDPLRSGEDDDMSGFKQPKANDLWQRLPKQTVPLTIELSPQRQFDDTLAPLYRGLFNNMRQEIQIQKSALSVDILASQRKLITQQAAISTGLDDIRKYFDDTKAALSNAILPSMRKHRKIIITFPLSWVNLLPTSIEVVMTKRGKVVASALNRLLMIRIDLVEVVLAEVVVVLVEVVEEMIEGILLRKGNPAVVVVDRVLVVNLMDLIDLKKRMLNTGCLERISFKIFQFLLYKYFVH